MTRQMVKDEVQAPTRELVRDEMYERDQIQLKKNNLMILNLEEPTQRQGEEEDIRRINEIISTKLNLTITINNAKRLGTYNTEKPRPVRVTLDRIDIKKQILQKAVTLRQLNEDDEYALVYIRPDLTKKQLEASKNLYTELRKKREEHPTQTWKIFKGEIIEVE